MSSDNDRAYDRSLSDVCLAALKIAQTIHVLYRIMLAQEDQPHLQASKPVEGVVTEDLIRGYLILTTSSKFSHPVLSGERGSTFDDYGVESSTTCTIHTHD
jgi:hypothetical protein